MKTEKKDIVVFAEDWGGLPSSTQHLVKHLARGRKVLWVNSIGLRSPKLNIKDVGRVCKKVLFKLIEDKRESTGMPDNISVMSVLTVPAPKAEWLRDFAALLTRWQVKRKIRKLKFEKPILWTSLPTAADLLGKLDESCSVYYCGDDFSSLAGVDHDAVAEHECDLVKNCDLVLTASRTLKNKFSHDNVYFLPHGVDFDLFSHDAPIANDLNEIKKQGKPIAGFYGSLSNWLDIDLIEYTARENSDWNFVFIGKECVNLSRLKRCPNIYFLGEKKHEELPGYSQYWQVSMLPFINNGQIQACNPLKLREYLAAGSRVLSTHFNAVEYYSEQIDIVHTHQQFSQHLNKYKIAQRDITRSYSVMKESWKVRAREVDILLEALS